MSAKDKIWQFFLSHDFSATNAEIANELRGQKGQLSWGQRVRELRKSVEKRGGELKCSEIRTGLYLYRVILPQELRA